MLMHFKEDAYFLDALDEAPTSAQSNLKVGCVSETVREIEIYRERDVRGRIPRRFNLFRIDEFCEIW